MSDPFAQVRAICLALDGVTERLSHGAPTFFAKGARGKSFCMCHDDHHGDGRLAVWVAAPEGAQEHLVAQDPQQYFRPPYVGTRGWVGVHLDRGAAPLQELLEDAHATVEPTARRQS
jgi:hypothetical protein